MFLFNSQRPFRLNLNLFIANMTFFLVLFQCLSFAPQLVQKLAAGFDPEQACTAVKMCVTESQTHVKPVEVREPNYPEPLAIFWTKNLRYSDWFQTCESNQIGIYIYQHIDQILPCNL